MRKPAALGAAFVGAVIALLATVAVAQPAYPPPTPTTPGKTPKPTHSPNPNKTPKPTHSPNPGGHTPKPGTSAGAACDLAHCLRMTGEVGGAFVDGKVEKDGDIRVAAVQGCCQSHAKVDVYMQSERVYLGTVYSNEDGSYLGTFPVPASIPAGKHTLIADIEGCGELMRPIEVLPAGTRVLGNTITNGDPGSGNNGPLPHTGIQLLMWILAALILLTIGTILTMSSKYARHRFAFVRAAADRTHVHRSADPNVPVVDTSRFVPYRSRVEETDTLRRIRRTLGGETPTVTEWDIAQQRNDHDD